MPDQQTQRFLSPEMVPRLAAIDIGSNSLRLVVAEALRGGRYRILDEERETTRLGQALSQSGLLDEESIEKSLACLNRFATIARGFGVSQPRAIATCAVREARNGDAFCERVRAEIGLEVEVISAEREARLAFHSVRRRFNLGDRTTVLADIGGGSTEIVIATGDVIESIFSTRLGTVRLTEKFGGGHTMAGDDYKRLVGWIDKQLKAETQRGNAPQFLIGSGGTFTTLASIIMARRGDVGLPVRGYRITRAELSHELDRLRKMSPKARRGVPGLSADRADIIVAGLAVIDRLMRRFQVNQLRIHNRGVRDGLLLEMIESLEGNAEATPVDRQVAVERLAERCHVDLPSSRHVAQLACNLYDQLAAFFVLPPADRSLLRAAALLQDVGYLINYDQHHKHSYHIILNSQLEGFEAAELELIANVARYHRGAEPKKKHRNLQNFSREERQRISRLAAILRLADGLDRSHRQLVNDVHVRHGEGQVELDVIAAVYPDVDMWGARRRAALFEKAFGVSLAIEWRQSSPRNGKSNPHGKQGDKKAAPSESHADG